MAKEAKAQKATAKGKAVAQKQPTVQVAARASDSTADAGHLSGAGDPWVVPDLGIDFGKAADYSAEIRYKANRCIMRKLGHHGAQTLKYARDKDGAKLFDVVCEKCKVTEKAGQHITAHWWNELEKQFGLATQQ